MKLKDKVAIVTGAGRGLGRGIALRLAREGCDLMVSDVDIENVEKVAEEIRTVGRKALFLRTDISVGSQVEEMVGETKKKFGRVDILVNNAGITTVGHITKLTEEEWDRALNINLRGAFLCSRAVAPIMIEQKSGRIINMSSKSGKQGGLWLSAYCASKFGLIGFTQSLALDLAEYGITVNALCPGIAFTPQWDKLVVEYARKLNIPESEVKSYYVKKIPLGRDATAGDVANVLVFLVSDDAGYMTGQAVNVTGGQEMR